MNAIKLRGFTVSYTGKDKLRLLFSNENHKACEIIPICRFIDEIVDIETEEGVAFSQEEIIDIWTNTAECCVYDWIENAENTVEDEAERKRMIDCYDRMSPSYPTRMKKEARRNELKTLFTGSK